MNDLVEFLIARDPYTHDTCGTHARQLLADLDTDPAVAGAQHQADAAREVADAAQIAADRIWETRLRELDLPDWFVEGHAAARKLERWDGD